MIHLYTGEGKGKTTAATGQAIRGLGSGYRVVFAQFMKGNESGELNTMERLSGIEVCRSNKNFGFYHTLTEEEKQELTKIHNDILQLLLEKVRAGSCDMLILDEVTYPVNWKLLDVEKLQELLGYGECVEIVMTGREPADLLVKSADYITEMKNVRHPYEKGVRARKGIEY